MKMIPLDQLNQDDVWRATVSLTRSCLVISGEGMRERLNAPHQLDHLYIKIDNDGQMELSTPKFQTEKEAYQFLEALYQIITEQLNNQYIWPSTMGDTSMMGSESTFASDLSYHFSFNESLIKKIYTYSKVSIPYERFQVDIYHKVVNEYFYYRPFLLYFLSSLRDGDNSFVQEHVFQMNLKRNPYEEAHEGLEELLNSTTGLTLSGITLNPLNPIGMTSDDLKFIHLFLLFILLVDKAHLTTGFKMNEASLFFVLDEMERLNQQFTLNLDDVLKQKREHMLNRSQTISGRLQQAVGNEVEASVMMKLAKQHIKTITENPYALAGFDDLELSTQILIKEALKEGLEVEMLDRADNFIKLTGQNHSELIQQATKTSLDSYSAVLAMENKVVTKKLLTQKGFCVPVGDVFQTVADALANYHRFENQHIVIKPKSTNFGLGISIIETLTSRELFKQALDIAFTHDREVIVEQFVSGNEYRFLVINNQVVGVLQRIPANVCGDGTQTIEQLIHEKNQHPLRGTRYKRPLEKIKIDSSLKLYLQEKGLTLQSVPDRGEIIQLRENSNISTGGDSVDMTDLIPTRFKDIAVQAVKDFNVAICGVDMMIENYENEASSYAIIEMNYNPAIHIHTYPFIGTGRAVAHEILKALQFIH